MTQKTILLVDDDHEIIKTTLHYLEQAGYEVLVAYNGVDALTTVRDYLPDCIVLDVMLPDLDGWEILRCIRKQTKTATIPVIMLTARIEEADKIHGLNLGADDYLTKPYSMGELIARIAARLRRAQPSLPERKLRAGQITLDLDAVSVSIAETEIDLTRTEFDLLRTLMQQPERVFTREELLEEALGYTYEGLGRTLDSHIKNLRRKIDLGDHQYIKTVYGIGYRFVEGTVYGSK